MVVVREDGTESLGKTEAKNRFVELRAKGWTYRRIAEELNKSKSTVASWGQELDAEIVSARAMELEGLQEEYGCVKEARIHSLGQLLNRLKGELEKRNLKKLSTGKLLCMVLKYQEALTAEFNGVVPLSEGQIAALKEKSGVKLNAEQIAGEMDRVLQRFRSGQLDEAGVRVELTVYEALLKVHEQVVLQAKVEQIESVLEKRR